MQAGTGSGEAQKKKFMSYDQQMKSQIELWQTLGKPRGWSQAKFTLVQYLQSYLIEIFRKEGGDDYIDEKELIKICE